MKNIIFSGTIKAKDIINGYFPANKFDIFISHSHSDRTKAIALANELYNNYGIISFIDSEFWEYKNDLQTTLNNKHSIINRSATDITYSYKSTIQVGNHVNVILLHSLKEMMDRCRCIIFLNTKNSINISDSIDEHSTYSPWIFYELRSLVALRKKERPKIQEIKLYSESANTMMNCSNINIEYDMTFINNIPIISLEELSNIHSSNRIQYIKTIDEERDKGLIYLYRYIEKRYNIDFESHSIV